MAEIAIDTDSFAPTVSDREDCGNPHGCICPAEEACQWPKLANLPRPDRTERGA